MTQSSKLSCLIQRYLKSEDCSRQVQFQQNLESFEANLKPFFFGYGLFFQIFRISLVSLASETSVLAFLLVTSLELKKFVFKKKKLRVKERNVRAVVSFSNPGVLMQSRKMNRDEQQQYVSFSAVGWIALGRRQIQKQRQKACPVMSFFSFMYF